MFKDALINSQLSFIHTNTTNNNNQPEDQYIHIKTAFFF